MRVRGSVREGEGVRESDDLKKKEREHGLEREKKLNKILRGERKS